MIIPNPDGISWSRWAETLILNNGEIQNQLYVMPEMRWKEFAIRLSLIEAAAPRPEFFRDWRAWATALRRALNS